MGQINLSVGEKEELTSLRLGFTGTSALDVVVELLVLGVSVPEEVESFVDSAVVAVVVEEEKDNDDEEEEEEREEFIVSAGVLPVPDSGAFACIIYMVEN